MNQLAFIKDGKVLTDSLNVAEVFGKEHYNVLRDIENLDCSEEFRAFNFEFSSYKSKQNKELPKADMTRDGFTFLAMGYTGKEAARFKEMYIGEFNRMEAQLKTVIPNYTPDQAIAVALQKTSEMLLKLPEIESRIDNVEQKLEEQVTLDSGQQEKLKRAVGAKVYSIESAKQYRRQLFAELYSEIKRRWGVPSYRDVRQQDLTGVLRYVDAWKPHTMILT